MKQVFNVLMLKIELKSDFDRASESYFCSTMQRLLLLFTLVLSASSLLADSLPKDYFRPPVDIPIYLAGNFGEIRMNHFHAGLDIKTQGRAGIPILACNEGFISRIKISLTGYGKVLYLDHPNGFTTVYAHLDRFSDKIEAYIKKHQYKKQSFVIEVYPENTELRIEKSELIGYSGNTGGSTAPHLHFEIRETESEKAVNPLLFNFPIKDNIAPEIKRLAIYPLNSVSEVQGRNKTFYVTCQKVNGVWQPSISEPIVVTGKIGFGIETIDRLNGVHNRNGIYSLNLKKNEKSVYRYEMSKFSFDETRYIHAHVDYRYWKEKGIRVQKCYLEPADKLSVYSNLVNNGQLFFLDSNEHQIEIEVLDSYRNMSSLQFKVQSKPKPEEIRSLDLQGQLVSDGQSAIIEAKGLRLELEENSLYSPAYFSISSEDAIGRAVSPIYLIEDKYTPLHDYVKLKLFIPSYKEKYQTKYVLAELTSRKGFKKSHTGTILNDSLNTEIRDLGYFTLMIDSVSPELNALNFQSGQYVGASSELQFKVEDELTNIESFNAYLDGEWILMEFDKKKDRLSINKNEWYSFPKGKHSLAIEVSDECGNSLRKEFTISF